VKIVEFDRLARHLKLWLKKSKYENGENFGTIPAGYDLLQDHGDSFFLRSINVREF